jgi:hypothetical protein
MLYETEEENETHQFFLNDAAASNSVTWFVPRTSPTKDQYSYNLTVITLEGKMQEFKNLTGKGKFLVIQDPNQ